MIRFLLALSVFCFSSLAYCSSEAGVSVTYDGVSIDVFYGVSSSYHQKELVDLFKEPKHVLFSVLLALKGYDPKHIDESTYRFSVIADPKKNADYLWFDKEEGESLEKFIDMPINSIYLKPVLVSSICSVINKECLKEQDEVVVYECKNDGYGKITYGSIPSDQANRKFCLFSEDNKKGIKLNEQNIGQYFDTID